MRKWEGFSFWPSFTDIITVTLLMFLLFLFAQITVNSGTLKAAELLKVQRRVRNEVMTALGPDSTLVTVDTNGNIQSFGFSDKVLFETGKAEVLQQGVEMLDRVGPVLRRHAADFKTLEIRGHTDRNPISTPRFPSNWELSSARATAVLRQLVDGKAKFDPGKLSCTGFASYRPVEGAEGTDPASFAKNRRVEISAEYTIGDFGSRPRAVTQNAGGGSNAQ